MCEVIRIKSSAIFPLVSEILEADGTARITVTGTSMYPFLREGIDSVELSKTDFNRIRRGDIVLIKRTNGQYILHRVISKTEDSFKMVGDAQQWIEGPLKPDQLIAIVTAIWRKEKQIPCSNLIWKILSSVWLLMRPFRGRIIKTYQKMRGLKY